MGNHRMVPMVSILKVVIKYCQSTIRKCMEPEDRLTESEHFRLTNHLLLRLYYLMCSNKT